MYSLAMSSVTVTHTGSISRLRAWTPIPLGEETSKACEPRLCAWGTRLRKLSQRANDRPQKEKARDAP
jgi:hypothetical protein